jgi:hypothetical protein
MGRKVHSILQGKGGVGKSFVASLLAQHYQVNADGNVVCVDTDPVNATFSGYVAFRTRRVELLDNGVVDSGRFDGLMMSIVEENADVIVDNGASCFIPLTKYLFESDALGVIGDTGRQVILHTVLTGAGRPSWPRSPCRRSRSVRRTRSARRRSGWSRASSRPASRSRRWCRGGRSADREAGPDGGRPPRHR